MSSTDFDELLSQGIQTGVRPVKCKVSGSRMLKKPYSGSGFVRFSGYKFYQRSIHALHIQIFGSIVQRNRKAEILRRDNLFESSRGDDLNAGQAMRFCSEIKKRLTHCARCLIANTEIRHRYLSALAVGHKFGNSRYSPR